MAPSGPGIRLLPNAITVLAMSAGLSSVHFALSGMWGAAIGAIAAAALFDGLDGRLARLLDATSKMGAELDSLADAISFGVAPALVIYVWQFEGSRQGWVIALVFAVCMVLRLARFNTLLEVEQPPYAKEFFVGVPAPAGGLLLLLPLIVDEQIGRPGWWSSGPVVAVWTVAVALLLVSRIPTLSVKTIKVPPRYVAPLLVLVGLLAAAVITFPLVALIAAMLVYLGHLPYSVRRYRWLAKHPEAWSVPAADRRAIKRAHGVAARRLGLRQPLGGRVAGAARRAVRRPRRVDPTQVAAETNGAGHTGKRRGWRHMGLRRQDRP
ncbi:CDP-diacylglycerol--serine O-phosphatidyltransferase [Saccharothrix longispora]|uniref:CDP-diacylglycerol--serine O-phosphatidyltransferase n=1 Tax=Saccharothrix longispora TaxID=33920 RepID=A0ABU1Q6Q7_9PSEU|nr:CDP-diacylglycerol--serine O-phosphatidyltransferase [Saccharothrix longispora]MDR6597809.1 CDP-diacylglycerol--serine O-phosphatidyltransferase [Saccharothrix longispora]MDU0294633.1 CDP-diacylglycerol--serine O-phosphatidyltransferase [Saccharothrix longispora]